MSYQLDPKDFYSAAPSSGTVIVQNRHSYHASSNAVDEILYEAWTQGDSPYAGICYLLERFSDSAGIDIPNDNYSMVELATMIAHVESDNDE